MSLILGIDPGSRVTGYGIVKDSGARQEYIASGCIRTTAGTTLPAKLEEIFSGVSRIIDEYVPDEFAVEKIFMARSAESALKLGHARGVAIVAAVNQGLPVFEYEARKVKQAVVGTGAAGKEQVQHMVQVLLRLQGKPQSDAADALAIALCHIHSRPGLARLSDAAEGEGGDHEFSRGRFRKAGGKHTKAGQ